MAMNCWYLINTLSADEMKEKKGSESCWTSLLEKQTELYSALQSTDNSVNTSGGNTPFEKKMTKRWKYF